MADPKKPDSTLGGYLSALGGGTDMGAAKLVGILPEAFDWAAKKTGHETHYGQKVENAVYNALQTADEKLTTVKRFNEASATVGQKRVYRGAELIAPAAVAVASLGTTSAGIAAVGGETLFESAGTYAIENPVQVGKTTYQVGKVGINATKLVLGGSR